MMPIKRGETWLVDSDGVRCIQRDYEPPAEMMITPTEARRAVHAAERCQERLRRARAAIKAEFIQAKREAMGAAMIGARQWRAGRLSGLRWALDRLEEEL